MRRKQQRPNFPSTHEPNRTARAASTLRETAQSIQSQYDDLTSQFHGHPASTPDSLSHPNDPTLSVDFARAGTRPKALGQSSLLKRDALKNATNSPKSVRFSDNPLVASEDDDAARNALFPYRDDPSGPPDQSHLDNQQIHEYHSQVIAEQDEQLDRLGDSISRQRELSIQIGDELDSHVQLLDGVDAMVDRHQSSLDKARKQLGTVARKAKDNMSMTIIVILIIVLILLIIILK